MKQILPQTRHKNISRLNQWRVYGNDPDQQEICVAVERVSLDDVQRLSEGKAAKRRGYGSRQIPHRLNQEERIQYNIAKEKGFLTIKSTGYRRERKGSPLANIYRQFCDAHGKPCVVVCVEQGQDAILVDVSTLRKVNVDNVVEEVVETVASLEQVERLGQREITSPFTILVPPHIVEATGEDDLDVIEHNLTAPIWQVIPNIVAFRCNRTVAKAMAKVLALG